MKKTLFISLLIALAFSGSALAWGVFIPRKELVKDSDLIVVGTLQSVSEYRTNEYDYGEGKILINRVISDNTETARTAPLKPGDKIQLKWQNPFISCPRVEHKRNENKEGIWLLKVQDDGTVRADYQERFISLDKLDEIKGQLRNSKKTRKVSKTAAVVNVETPSVQPPANEINLPVAPAVDALPAQTKQFSLTRALIAASLSLALYWLLYRSKFKIR